MRIAVCAPQVPFERGGTEILAEMLTRQLRERGHEVDEVRVPFKWYPGARVLSEALVWRLLDLDLEDRPVDLVIATKFPSYAIRHPKKVVWLVHQFRQAYELDGPEFGQFSQAPFDRATVRSIHRVDRKVLGEADRLFAISQNVADRLERSTGLVAEVLPPPPQQLDYRPATEDGGDFILSVGRLDRAKRVDLLLEAAAVDTSLQVVVAGDGPDRERLERLSAKHRLNGRVTFAGRVTDDALVDLYARCLAVYYAPFDEDFGFVPYEAFLSEKPVVTTRDAGGPLEVVVDRQNGLVSDPVPEAVAAACSWLTAHPDRARAWGRAGKETAERITWDAVVDRLVGS
ncbi:MAG TPA: glycosyltransferase family 4 protein [Gaiellaceae bacterium]|nr:glycosyltransferase family 4 protein [Gaiellaceae bacterium]